jgi:cell wall integrity and stress response component
MVLIRFVSVLAAASMLLTAAAQDDSAPTPTTTVVTKSITTPTTTLRAPAQVSIGCFATSTPLESHGEFNFQSPGNCQLVCLQEGKDVFAVSDGTTCWCGDKIPPKDSQVADDKCDTTCAGTDVTLCKLIPCLISSPT